MGLIRFLFYRKQETSILASRKFGEKQVNPNELEKPLLATKILTSAERDLSNTKRQKIGIVGSGRKALSKIYLVEIDKENKNL